MADEKTPPLDPANVKAQRDWYFGPKTNDWSWKREKGKWVPIATPLPDSPRTIKAKDMAFHEPEQAVPRLVNETYVRQNPPRVAIGFSGTWEEVQARYAEALKMVNQAPVHDSRSYGDWCEEMKK